MADDQNSQIKLGDTVQVPPVTLDTPQSDAAIDDIVAKEADEVIAAQDAAVADAESSVDETIDTTPHGHPLFWFFVALLVIIALFGAYVLLQPGLNVPFLK